MKHAFPAASLLLATALHAADVSNGTSTTAPSTTTASTAAAPTAAPTEQDSSLDSVVVRNRNRLEPFQDVPTSVSVVSGEELDRLNAISLGAITERTANVSWNLGNSRTSSLSIRGIGKQAQTDAMDPSVGVVVDGVAYAYNPLASFDFTDISDVEVLRGPQGTQGGKDSNLGVINITTRQPSFTPDANYSITLGEHRTVLAEAAGGGPVIDDLLAWRGTFSANQGDGAIRNAYNTDQSYQNLDNVSGRVQFLLTPTSNFSALLRVDYEPRHNAYYNGWLIYSPTPTAYANGQPNPLTSDASTRLARSWFTQEGNYSYLGNYLGNSPTLDNQQPLVTASGGASTQLNWNLGFATLTSITAYKDYQFQARNDEGTPFDISKNGGGHVYYRQGSEELRLSSQEGGFIDYTAGLYLLGTSNNYDSGSGYGSDAGAWFASNTQYNLLDANGDGRYLLSESLNRLNYKPLQHIRNKTIAAFGQINWHLSDPFTVLTGLRLNREDRQNTTNKVIYDEGFAAELNPVAVNGVQLGGFNSNAQGVLGANTAAQLALANSVALKYFGAASYGALSASQMAQVAAAKAIRQTQLGVLWNTVAGPDFVKTQPNFVISPTYKINDRVSAYLSARYGEKAGISQVINGIPFLAKPEESAAYELGFKSVLLDKKLVFNADIYLNNITNYQQAVQVFDLYTTALKADGTSYYTAATGNAAKVRASGLEIDSTYTPIPELSLRFAGAYNNAIYKDFKNSAQPLENANLKTPYRDVSGENLPGAAKFTADLSADYRVVLHNALFHTDINYAFSSRYNSDPALSSYGWVPAYGIADFSLGIGPRNEKFDVSVVVKNLFNNETSQVVLWNSYVPALPRWFGVTFKGKI